MKKGLYSTYAVTWGGKKRTPRKQHPADAYVIEVEKGMPEEIYAIYRYLPQTPENYKKAQKILGLAKEYPANTPLPELMTLEWLIRMKHDYLFQPGLHGGRLQKGGLLPDFVIPHGSTGDAWLVQGDYFHGEAFQARHGQAGRDALATSRIKGQTIGGVRVKNVVQIRESSIYRSQDQTLSLAYQGVSS